MFAKSGAELPRFNVGRRRSNGGYRLSLSRLFFHVLTWSLCQRGAPRPDMRWVTREWLSPREVVMSSLAIYPRDHHAAAVAGTRLARRAPNVVPRDASGQLPKVAKEIAEDLATLERFMGRLGTRPDRVKDAIARAGERLGRLKLNDRLRTRSPLSDVVELETLVVGIAGKEALRSSLRSATSLPSEELNHLIDRAEGQKRIVDERGKPLSAKRSISTTVLDRDPLQLELSCNAVRCRSGRPSR